MIWQPCGISSRIALSISLSRFMRSAPSARRCQGVLGQRVSTKPGTWSRSVPYRGAQWEPGRVGRGSSPVFLPPVQPKGEAVVLAGNNLNTLQEHACRVNNRLPRCRGKLLGADAVLPVHAEVARGRAPRAGRLAPPHLLRATRRFPGAAEIRSPLPQQIGKRG